MNIRHQRSNFSQFSDALWLVVESGDTSTSFEVEQEELLEFAAMLIDIADDCICKAEPSSEELDALSHDLCDACDRIYEANKHRNKE